MQNLNFTLSKVDEFKQDVLKHAGEGYMSIVRDFISLRPFENHWFYIFSFIKKQNNERFHQPRLTRPEPVPGGTLIWVDPSKPEEMKLCWTLPSIENFSIVGKGKAFGDQFVWECVQTYLKNPQKLMEEDKPISKEKFVDLYKNFVTRFKNFKEKEKLEKIKSEQDIYQKI